jgi:hypothetical protein
LFTLGSFFAEAAKIFGQIIFPLYKLCIDYDKNALDTILGDSLVTLFFMDRSRSGVAADKAFRIGPLATSPQI